MPVVPGAVNDRGKPPLTEKPGTGDHAIPVPTPTMSKNDGAPGWHVGFNSPYFQKTAVNQWYFGFDGFAPIRFILHRISWNLLNKVGQKQSEKRIQQ